MVNKVKIIYQASMEFMNMTTKEAEEKFKKDYPSCKIMSAKNVE